MPYHAGGFGQAVEQDQGEEDERQKREAEEGGRRGRQKREGGEGSQHTYLASIASGFSRVPPLGVAPPSLGVPALSRGAAAAAACEVLSI